MSRKQYLGSMDTTRCIDGRLFRHAPGPDDPYCEVDVGECKECGGKGCHPCERCGRKLDAAGECDSCNRDRQEGEAFAATTPKFSETFCSQCGGKFGPGDKGYSHCEDHLPRDKAVRIEAGKIYLNGHGEECGPMKEARCRHGLWIDQHGAAYTADGIQWAHHPESAGNLKLGAAMSAADGAKT